MPWKTQILSVQTQIFNKFCSFQSPQNCNPKNILYCRSSDLRQPQSSSMNFLSEQPEIPQRHHTFFYVFQQWTAPCVFHSLPSEICLSKRPQSSSQNCTLKNEICQGYLQWFFHHKFWSRHELKQTNFIYFNLRNGQRCRNQVGQLQKLISYQP